jgi:hypothetical protein
MTEAFDIVLFMALCIVAIEVATLVAIANNILRELREIRLLLSSTPNSPSDSAIEPVQLSSGQNGQGNKGEISVVPIEKHRSSPKQETLLKWLNSNQWHEMTVREIAVRVGVSKSLVSDTVKHLR